MAERDMARYFDERQGDLSLWADKPTPSKVRKGGTIIISLRISKGELELLQSRAQEEGLSLSGLIRRTALRGVGAAASSACSVFDLESRAAGNFAVSAITPTLGLVGSKKSVVASDGFTTSSQVPVIPPAD